MVTPNRRLGGVAGTDSSGRREMTKGRETPALGTFVRRFQTLRHEMVRRAGAVELNGAEADAESAVGVHHHRHPGLSRCGIERRGWGGGKRGGQIEGEPAEDGPE